MPSPQMRPALLMARKTGPCVMPTVPGDKLANRVLVGPLAAGGRQAVQHDGLGLATASFTVANSVADPRYPCGVCQE